jgi:hypothetical protein
MRAWARRTWRRFWWDLTDGFWNGLNWLING